MTDTVRFHLDENVNPAIAKALRRRGVDVTTTQEVGLTSAADEKQFLYATSEGRVLVTHDGDFIALARSGISHSGIAYCDRGLRTIGEIIEGLVVICECLTEKEMENHVEFL